MCIIVLIAPHAHYMLLSMWLCYLNACALYIVSSETRKEVCTYEKCVLNPGSLHYYDC